MTFMRQVVDALRQKSQEADSPNVIGPLMELVAGKEGGGLEALVQKFQAGGLGGVIASWIGTGENQPISPERLHEILGSEQVQQLAAKTGLPVDRLLPSLADHLPAVVDKLTPEGKIPEGGLLQAALRMFGQKA